jgi:hypothetical protein
LRDAQNRRGLHRTSAREALPSGSDEDSDKTSALLPRTVRRGTRSCGVVAENRDRTPPVRGCGLAHSDAHGGAAPDRARPS